MPPKRTNRVPEWMEKRLSNRERYLEHAQRYGWEPAEEHEKRRHATRMSILKGVDKGDTDDYIGESDLLRRRQAQKHYYNTGGRGWLNPDLSLSRDKAQGVVQNPRELELMDPPHPYFLPERAEAAGVGTGEFKTRKMKEKHERKYDARKYWNRFHRGVNEESLAELPDNLRVIYQDKSVDNRARRGADKAVPRHKRYKPYVEGFDRSVTEDVRGAQLEWEKQYTGHKKFFQQQDTKKELKGIIDDAVASSGGESAPNLANSIYKTLMRKLNDASIRRDIKEGRVDKQGWRR